MVTYWKIERKDQSYYERSIQKKIIADRKYDKFQLGTLYEFDVTDYTQVDYTPHWIN